MNKKFALYPLYLTPVLLAGCIAQQPMVRREPQPLTFSPPAQAGMTPQQQAAAASPWAKPTQGQAAPAATAATGPASAQAQQAFENAVLCRAPLGPNALRTRMERDGVFSGPPAKDQTQTMIYRVRAPLTVAGMPVKAAGFWGDDGSDSGEYVYAVTDANVLSAVKAMASNGIRLKKLPKNGGYEAKTPKYGTIMVTDEKGGGARIACGVGMG